MAALYILIPVAVVLVAVAIWVFFWAVDSGQFDDLTGRRTAFCSMTKSPSVPRTQDDAKQQAEQHKGD